jgi:hypothetical protein
LLLNKKKYQIVPIGSLYVNVDTIPRDDELCLDLSSYESEFQSPNAINFMWLHVKTEKPYLGSSAL